MKYARQCSVTGEGMNAGWVGYDGDIYIKHQCDVIAWIKNEEKCEGGVLHESENAKRVQMYENYTDNQWLDFAYNMDMVYWTEWEDEDEYDFEDGLPPLHDEKELTQLVQTMKQEIAEMKSQIAKLKAK